MINIVIVAKLAYGFLANDLLATKSCSEEVFWIVASLELFFVCTLIRNIAISASLFYVTDPSKFHMRVQMISLPIESVVSLSLLINGLRIKEKLSSCLNSTTEEVGSGSKIKVYFNFGLVIAGFYA